MSSSIVKADAAQVAAIASAESKDVLRASTAVVNISTAKSEAIATGVTNIATAKSEALVAAQSADTVLSTAVSSAIATEKGRIDAILLASDADKNSFAEIVSLINSVDTTNDTAFGGYVTSNNAALSTELVARASGDTAAISSALSSSIVKADAAQAAAIASAESKDVVRAATASTATATVASGLSTELIARADGDTAAIASALSSAESKDVLRAATAVTNIANAKSEAIATGVTNIATAKSEAIATGVTNIATAKSEAIASALSSSIVKADAALASATLLTNALDSRIDTLEGQDIVQQVGTFVSGTSFTVANPVVTTDLGLKVFINGLQIHANASGDGYTVVGGRTFTLVTLGYAIDANDHIVVYGVNA